MEETRYKKMVEITQETQKYILEFLSTNKNMSQDCKESFMFLYKRRLTKKVWLRPFVVASVYEYFSGKSYVNILPAVAAAEVFNISTYQSNIVFDDKINDNHTSSINQVISSYISFNIAVQMLTSIENIDDKKKLACIQILNDNNKDVYTGQYIDLNVLIFRDADRISNMPPKEYLELYKRRCDLIGGTTVENCAFWAVTLAGIEDKTVIKEVKNVYRQWGKMMQMVNDLSDFAVFLNKKVDMDFIRYTDIRAGKITLPFYFILKDLKEKEKINRTIKWIGHKEKQQLDDFFAPYLQKDSTILTEVFNIILEEWKICKSEKNSLHLDNKKFHYLFESAFLTKFMRVFYSTKLIKAKLK